MDKLDRRSTRAIFFSPLALPRIVLPDGSFRHNARRQNKNKKIKKRVVWHFYSTRKGRVRRETIDPLCSTLCARPSVPRLPIFIPARDRTAPGTRARPRIQFTKYPENLLLSVLTTSRTIVRVSMEKFSLPRPCSP